MQDANNFDVPLLATEEDDVGADPMFPVAGTYVFGGHPDMAPFGRAGKCGGHLPDISIGLAA